MSETENSLQHYRVMPVKKKRGAMFLVVVISVIVHMIAGGVLGVIKIVEELTPEPEFEAPPVVAVKPPPPPPPPPPTTKRAQKSLPRPQPLAAQTPQNMNVPAIEIDDSNLTVGGGRGFGGGLGQLGGAVADSLRISFFGMESSGGNVAILFDRSNSASEVFKLTRRELFKTMEQFKAAPDARLALIYFGGKEGGMHGLKGKKNPLSSDYWFPDGVREGKWLSGQSSELDEVRDAMNAIQNPEGAKSNSYDQMKKDENKFFVLGTQYWGALNAAYAMKPSADTIYLICEPRIAFKNIDTVEESFAVFDKKGRDRPSNTKIVFVLCGDKLKKGSGLYDATHRMLQLLHGGELSDKELREQVVYAD